MRVIHVLRKPCAREAGTVAANVLRWGTGALNIDASRVGTAADVPSVHATRKSDYPQSYKGNGAGWGRTRGGYAGDEVHWEPKGGRWPANLVLQHLDGCRQEGTKEVRVVGATAHKAHHQTHSWASVGTQSHEHPGYRNEDGKETVAAWTCEPGCPVAALDAQSGNLSVCGSPKQTTHDKGMFGIGQPGRIYGDTGGASRFFKQVGGKGEP
jgi:hypothetical protein